MLETKKIVIAEDVAIFREALKMLLSVNPAYEVVGEAEDGLQAIRFVESQQPALILMDLSMPRMNAVAAIPEIKRLSPSTKILVLTGHKSDDHIRTAFETGVDGYILKDDTYDELMLAIDSIFSGRSYISSGISEKVINGYLDSRNSVRSSGSCDSLTIREREILKMVAEGCKNKEIAGHLFISTKTVEKHRANIMKKLDLHNTSSLTAFAMEKGMIT